MERTQGENIKSLKNPGKSRFFVLAFSMFIFVPSTRCQDTISRQDNIINNKHQEFISWGSQPKFIPGLLPSFFEKEETIGSPYLSLNWMRGVIELSDHRRIPHMNEYLYFNYDKVNIRLILINSENKIWSYPVDSISEFILGDSDKTFFFEKVSFIGGNFLVEPLLKSENGYSLYRRIITKMIKANYESWGYTAVGKKYDEYVDYYEYYLIYPDKKKYKKFYLNGKPVRKIFKDISVQPSDSFNHIKYPVTEQNLVSFIEMINASNLFRAIRD